MAIDQTDQTVVTHQPATAADPATTQTTSHRFSTATPAGSELIRRIVILVFGLIQIAIGLRILLLLLDAREANGLVSAVLNVSQIFVAPFEGILRTDAVHASGSTLDITAIVALVGWTILELIVLWAIGLFRRQSAPVQA